jgi:FixJ family two-component response regulator
VIIGSLFCPGYDDLVVGGIAVANQPKSCVVAVVDDDPRVRESVYDLLASAGFEPRLFISAEDFMSTSDLELSCCLITDVRMPGMDGWELQRLAVQKLPKLPIVFITAHQDDEARKRAMELGAFALLYKPFDGEELLEAVGAAIKKYHSTEARG